VAPAGDFNLLVSGHVLKLYTCIRVSVLLEFIRAFRSCFSNHLYIVIGNASFQCI